MNGHKLPPLPAIKEIVRLYKLRAKKQLSQNFILNYNLCRKIVKKAGNLNGHHVCEVGPGPGGITRAILEAGCKSLSVIEKDRRFLPSLQELNRASGGRMNIYQGDVLNFQMYNVFPEDISRTWGDKEVMVNEGEMVGCKERVGKGEGVVEENERDKMDALIEEKEPGLTFETRDVKSNNSIPHAHIIGNLPFSISTPLLIRWLREISLREGAWCRGRVPLTLTFQNEVAERIVAMPLDVERRCRLSVMCQNWCHVSHKLLILGESFVPAPEVDVGLVQLIPRKRPLIPDVPFDVVEKLLRHLFHYRQKNCKHSLATLFPPDRPDLTQRLLRESGVGADWVSYTMDMQSIARLCHVYKLVCLQEPLLLSYNYRSKENAAVWRNKSKLKLADRGMSDNGLVGVVGDDSGVGSDGQLNGLDVDVNKENSIVIGG